MKKADLVRPDEWGFSKQHEQGLKVADICRQHSIRVRPFQLEIEVWGIQASDIKQLRELEEENRKLKQMYVTWHWTIES